MRSNGLRGEVRSNPTFQFRAYRDLASDAYLADSVGFIVTLGIMMTERKAEERHLNVFQRTGGKKYIWEEMASWRGCSARTNGASFGKFSGTSR